MIIANWARQMHLEHPIVYLRVSVMPHTSLCTTLLLYTLYIIHQPQCTLHTISDGGTIVIPVLPITIFIRHMNRTGFELSTNQMETKMISLLLIRHQLVKKASLLQWKKCYKSFCRLKKTKSFWSCGKWNFWRANKISCKLTIRIKSIWEKNFILHIVIFNNPPFAPFFTMNPPNPPFKPPLSSQLCIYLCAVQLHHHFTISNQALPFFLFSLKLFLHFTYYCPKFNISLLSSEKDQ